MPENVRVKVNGREVSVAPGTSAAAAVILAGFATCRTSVTGSPRAPLCGMGICFECRATVNGVAHARTCQLICQPGMEIRTDAA